MNEENRKSVADRRNFLKLAGIGLATAGGALATTAPKVQAGEPDKPGALYRESEHIRKYYETARG